VPGRLVLAPPRALLLDGRRYALADFTPVLSILPYEDFETPFLLALMPRRAADRLARRLLDPDDPLDTPDVREIARAVVLAATGWPWYCAGRLAGTVVQHASQITGALALRGIDLAATCRRNPALALNAVYALMIEHADDRRRLQLDAELERPPAGETPQGSTVEEEGQMFLRALAQG
jgi:hypothetical protein